MTGFRPFLLTTTLTALVVPLVSAPKPSNVPARVTFADSVDDEMSRIRSDGGGSLGVYLDGEDCVQTWYALPKGNFFLRTVRSGCNTVASRTLVLDFSDRVWPSATCGATEVALDRDGRPLYICDVNAVPDARLVADKLYSANATGLTIPFSLQADFRFTAFELDFVETLTVSVEGTGRKMTADSAAIAELWQINGRSKTLLGRYRMPFSATVESAGS